MIAKILQKDDVYYSYVFAAFDNRSDSKVLVFHNASAEFRMVNIYQTSLSLTRVAFIIDPDLSDYIKIQNMRPEWFDSAYDVAGYDWILNDSELLKNMMQNRKIPPEIIERARQLNAQLEISEWNDVKDPEDAEKLQSAALGFHDAVIDRLEYTLHPSRLTVHFTECWNAEFDLIFEGDIAIQNTVDELYPVILDSSILFEKGFIYWVDEDIESTDEITAEDQYFRARSLKWRMKTPESELPTDSNHD